MLQNGLVVNRRIILVSALTAPEKVKPCLRGGIWIYAGKNLNRFHIFEKHLGKEMIHASPAQFREFTISNRHAFVKWTERVHSQYGHDVTHWLSDTFGSNPYMSNLFSNFMNLVWLRSILTGYPKKDIVFIAESHALLSVADVVSSEDNGNEIYRYGFSKERLRVILKIGRSILSGYVNLLRLVIRKMFAYAYRIPDLKSDLQKVSVIIDTYIFENSFDKCGRFINRYFPELHEYLSTNGSSVGILGVFHNISLNRFKYIFKSIFKGKTKFVLIENFLKPIDYVGVLVYPLKRLWCFERVQSFLGVDVQLLVHEENLVNINSSSSIISLLLHKLPKRLHEKGINPSLYINWSENQLIDKALISGFHKYLIRTKIIGGKPFIPPFNHLNLFNTKSERIFGYAPDRVVTCGKRLKNMFSIYDKDGDYNVGPSFRYGYLMDIIDSNSINSEDTSKCKIISVILPYSEPISKHVLESSKKAIRNAVANGWKIKIKVHPTLTKSDRVALLKKYDMKSSSIELTYEDMASLLSESSAVLASASSVAIEAICLGMPVVAVGMPIGLDFNMLDSLPSSMWRLAFTDDDIDLGLNEWALCHPVAIDERREIGRKVLLDFFGENTNESLQIYLEPLDNTK